MPKLKPETLQARRRQILDAAEACFGRAGFHQTTMQDICTQAQLSAGAVYSHFASKEDLIAGIAARESAEIANRLSQAANSHDILQALSDVAEHYTVVEPHDKNRLFMEIGCESTRNETVGKTFADLDHTILSSLTALIEKAAHDGRIKPDLPPETVGRLIQIIGDGFCWRRAIEPDFDSRAHLPAVVDLIGYLIKPVEHPLPVKLPEVDEPATAGQAHGEKETA